MPTERLSSREPGVRAHGRPQDVACGVSVCRRQGAKVTDSREHTVLCEAAGGLTGTASEMALCGSRGHGCGDRRD